MQSNGRDATDVVIRTLKCDGMKAVHCLTVTPQGIWWCSVQRQLYFWNAQDKAHTQLTELAEVPQLLRATDDASDLFILYENEGAFYKLYELGEEAEEGEEADENTSVTYELEHRQSFAARCRGAATAALSANGTFAAVATPATLLLFCCPTQQDGPATSVPYTPGVLEVSCMDYYSQASCAHCCFVRPDVLALVSSEDHLVSVRIHWNAGEVLLERDGHVLSRPHHVLCMAASCCSNSSLLVVGLSDGTIRLLQPETLEVYKTIDVFAFLERCLEAPVGPRVEAEWAEKPWRRGISKRAPSSASPSYAKLTSAAVGAAAAAKTVTPAELSAVVVDTAVGPTYIMATTNDAVVYIRRDSFDFDTEKTFFLAKGAVSGLQGLGERLNPSLGIVQCAADGSWVTWDGTDGEICYGVNATASEQDDEDDQHDVIHARRPLPKGWLDPPQPPASALGGDKGVGGSGVASGRPVRRPKGSGYADAPWSVQQQRRLASKRKEAQGARRIGSGAGSGGEQKKYKLLQPFSDHPLEVLKSASQYLAAPVHQGAVTCLACTASGSIVSGSQDKSARLTKYPLAKHKGEGVFLRGHAGAVECVDCSLSQQQPTIVTGGAGGQLCVWRPQNKLSPFIDLKAAGADGDIRGVRFFYADKFISYAQSNKLHLCKYVVNGQEEGWKAVESRSMLTAPIYTYTFDTAQNIASMSCINYFTSSLIVLAGTNKELRVLDVASGQPLWCTADAHSRAIHSIAMCDAGRFVTAGTMAPSATHTFFTAGMDSAVVLWDVRQPRRARQFTLHRNNALARVGLAASPEGYRIAVGSEDNTVVVYDTRHNGAPLQTVPTLSTCTALVWHPLDPVLIAGTNGAGYVSVFGQKA